MATRWKKWYTPSLAQLKKVHVTFDAWDPQSKGAKCFLFQVSNSQLLRSNPKCVVEQTMLFNKAPPQVEFTFKNDVKWLLPVAGRSDSEILLEMALQTERLQNSMGLGEEEDMVEEEDEQAAEGAKAGGKK